MAKEVGMEFAFFEFLRSFYVENKGIIRNRYREITKKYLENPNGILELDNAVISKISLGSSRGTKYENLLNYIFKKYSDDVAELIDKIDKYVNEKTLIDILFDRKYRNLDYERKKLILIKVLFNKNKIVSLYNSYNHDKAKTFTKSYRMWYTGSVSSTG